MKPDCCAWARGAVGGSKQSLVHAIAWVGLAAGLLLMPAEVCAQSLSIGDVSIVEGGFGGTKVATFTVTLSAPSASLVTYTIATSNGTARLDPGFPLGPYGDYVASSLLGGIDPGQTSNTFSVTILGDTEIELDETFKVSLSAPVGATIADPSATGTILNDDGPALSIGDVSIAEGNSGTQVATFTVRLSEASTSAVTYTIATADGTATAGTDYVSVLAGQSITAGQTSKTFAVTINSDATVEPNETFLVNLSAPVGGIISDHEAFGAIINDDGPTLSIADMAIVEGDAGTQVATLTVTLSQALANSVTYSIDTANVNAIAGADYMANNLAGEAIAAGQTSKTFAVTINGDTIFEGNERFAVDLGSAVGATIFDSRAYVTITDDDARPTLSIDDVSILEGNSGTKVAIFTASLSAASSTAVTFRIATANGTATAATDYVSRSLVGETIAAGLTSKTFAVTINGDATFETDENFYVNLSSVVGATVLDGQAIGTIINDEDGALPTLSIADVAIAEGDDGTKVATFTVTLSAPSASLVTYTIATADGTATAGIDYVGSTLAGETMVAGQTSKTFAVMINGDTTVEADETFTVNLSAPVGATTADSQAIGTITTDDAPVLSIENVAIVEDNGSNNVVALFTVSLSAASSGAVAYTISTTNGTATAGTDYAAKTLVGETIFPGQTSKTFAVTSNYDVTDEANETFFVTLSSPTGATIGNARATGTIVDNDNNGVPPTTLSIADLSISEGNSGVKSANFWVTLSGAADVVTYTIATANGTAIGGADYVAKSLVDETISFGSSGKFFSVVINGDATPEAAETFTVNLSSVVGAITSDAQAIGTILNDDGPALSIGDVSITEGNNGTKEATFTVSLSAASTNAVTYQIATTNGTAIAGTDYAITLVGDTIAPGQTSKTFAVIVNGDYVVEANETFSVNLIAPVGATIADGQAMGTIVNDDPYLTEPSLSIDNVFFSEGNSVARYVTFTVKLSAVSASTVTYSIATADGTAVAGSDYVAQSLTGQTIAAGTGTTSKTFTVEIRGDSVFEPDETFLVNVSSVVGATVTDAQAIGLIQNDDAAPTLSIGDVSISEGDSGTKVATFTVTLSAVSASGVTYDISTSTANGTATPGTDYVSRSLVGETIAAGLTSKTFAVTIYGDTTVEADETFTVNVTPRSGATISDGSATGTILNDDVVSGPPPQISVSDVTTTEGNSGSKQMTFTVGLSASAAAPVSFDVWTSPGTAAAGSDYQHLSLTGQTIAAGQTSATFSVNVIGEALVESNETFTMNLNNVSGASVSDGQGLGIIANDDLAALTVNPTSIVEGNSGFSTATFQVTLSAPMPSPVTFDISTSNGTATAGSDYEARTLSGVSIDAGRTRRVFEVKVFGDTSAEGNETFNVLISGVSGAVITTPSGVGTITNDDAATLPTLSIDDVSISEGNSGTKVATFTVTLSAASASPVTATLTLNDGTAIFGVDYSQSSNSYITIPAGHTSLDFNVSIWGDTVVEPNETFFVDISDWVGVTVSDVRAMGTITNDDLALAINSQPASNGGTGAITIGSLSMDGIQDDQDDGQSEHVSSRALYATRLAEAADALCQVGSPMVVGVAQVENRGMLADLAGAVEIICAQHYRAFTADDAAGTMGFLVSTAEVRPGIPQVELVSLAELGKTERLRRNDGLLEALHPQPPEALAVRVNSPDGSMAPLTVLMAMIASEDPAKHSAQAQSLAKLVQGLRHDDPGLRLVLLREGSAADTSLGDLIDLTILGGSRREGDAAIADHILVSPNLLRDYPKLHVEATRSQSVDRSPQVLVLPRQ